MCVDMSSSDKRSWANFVNDSMAPTIKDETVDWDVTEILPPQTNDIGYTIVDSKIDPFYPKNYHSIRTTPIEKPTIGNDNKPKKNITIKNMLTMSAPRNTQTDFTRGSTSLPNATTLTIKQQPFSPPPYHPLTNGSFTQHHHQQRTTPSPDNEQISPLSNNLVETSSPSTIVPPSATGGAPICSEDKRRCAVCNDIASGYHYGVWSCEGCKAFFKRSIQGTNEYICPATNTCTIDKHRRKSCQACRLRKCYEVGMTKGTTRRERKYRKKAVSVCKITSTSSNSTTTSNSNRNNQEHGLLVTNSETLSAMNGTSCQTNNNNNNFSSLHSQKNKTNSESIRIPMAPAEFIATLSQASRLNLPAKVDSNRPLDDQYFLQLLAKIFDQELVVLINWAKAMPGYTESLTLDQQVTIIEQSWLDTLLLDTVERSLERSDDTLHFAPDFIISRNRSLSSPGVGAICTSLFNILQAFKEPRTTHEEFIALKAAILINSIPTTITTTKSFRLLTKQIYESIQYTCDSNPSVYQDNSLRHFTLLLQLPHIKMLSSKLIRLFLNMRANDLLPQADLLLEMLDAQDTFDLNRGFLSINSDANNLPLHTPNFSQNLTDNNNTKTASTMSQATLNNSKTQSNCTKPINYVQKHQDDNQNSNIDESNRPMNYRMPTSTPMMYSTTMSGKRSPSTPPLQYCKQPRNELIQASPPTSMHFPMNNSSY
ncbi:unnamed protein product [Rotaria magnacalcarata]|uniref:Estrogen receptor n=3 Tax=Rotaria magnacalcarata TaxID=392030 RepID=A0A816S2P6_9BILA|nr:unnamed protein product [Rotaria magnacalcarata]